MGKFIFSILLASAATSALAAPPDPNQESIVERPQAREQRQEVREQRQVVREESRQQRSDGASDFGRARQQEQQPQAEARRQWQGGNFNGGQRDEARQQQWQGRRDEAGQQQWQGRRFDGRNDAQAQVQTPRAPDQQRSTWTGTRDGSRWTGDRSTWTGNRDGRSGSWSGGDLRQGDRPIPNVMRDRNPTIVNQSQQTQNRWSHSGTWNRDWRNDRRYDWRRYRDNHRSIFHIGIYYDPFGYNYYRPFDIGYRLYPNYYGQQYWIDPGLYNLPYPPPGTVWVRYWDDALLVDTYSGEVIDVIRNFFW